jgi:uncharacterized protein
MKAREGDLIKTVSNVVFDVKGLIQPPEKIIAFPRFIPSTHGTRQGANMMYGKVYSLDERFKYLKEKQPDLIVFDPVFGETLCEVPKDQIVEHYQPIEKLEQLRTCKNLTALEDKALQLATTLKEKANIPWSKIGISGSIMTGLTTQASDIDPIVYGTQNSRKAYSALRELLKDESSGFKPYNRKELKTLFDFRSKDTIMSFENFVLVEDRKAFQGMFMGTDYFVRFLKDWNEVNEQYGDVCYSNSGYAKIKASIIDDSETIFTPCTYQVDEVQVLEGPQIEPIREIVSFRGRFCQQALNSEHVEAQGKVELVTDKKGKKEYYRIILGNKPSDYMMLSQ